MSHRVYTVEEQQAMEWLRDTSTKRILLVCKLAPEVLRDRAQTLRNETVEAQNALDALTIFEAKP